MKYPLWIAGLVCATSLYGMTFTVTNTNDTGAGSLRQAMLDANAMANANASTPDIIAFAIPGSGVHTIAPTSALPPIIDPVIIDGYTQTGSSANTLAVGDNAMLLIEINGPSSADAFDINAGGGGSTIRGLVVNRSSTAITINSDNNVIAGNFIGTDPTGNSEEGNPFGGVVLNSGMNNLIGGTTPASRNIIAGSTGGSNFGDIAFFNTPGPTGTKIQGNYIGTNAAGTAAIHSQAFQNVPGISFSGGTNTLVGGDDAADGTVDGNIGARNVISGTAAGIYLPQVIDGLTVEGNFIGVDASGTNALGNYGDGITSSAGSGIDHVVIGGTTAGAGNVISGNAGEGIQTEALHLTIQGNFIGTDITGTLNLGNSVGVHIALGGSGSPPFVVQVGGASAAARNIISGNKGVGLYITGLVSGTVTAQGNYIGVEPDGTTALGNTSNGVELNRPATIGGTNAGEGNVIAHNNGAGVFIDNGFLLTVPIEGNSISQNSGLGINLGGGLVMNDTGDGDTGNNDQQNFPVITSASFSGGNVTIGGTFNSKASMTYRLEFFANAAADSSGYGEGQTYLGSTSVTTDGSGNVPFSASFAYAGSSSIFASTATDPIGNTSEFSQDFMQAPPGQLLNISTRLRVLTNDNVLIGGFIVGGTDAKKVIVRGLGPSLQANGQPIAGRLADPTLGLFDSTQTQLAFNDNWKDTDEAAIQATMIPPPDDLESAIVSSLPANNSRYTAIVSGNNRTTGVGLVEVYDLDTAANSHLANISTRGFVDTGDNVMIGGFIVGNGTVHVIVRGLGPSLSDSGVANPVADPTLELHDTNGTLINSNDNWKDTDEAAIQETTIPPTNDKESAIVTTLVPGNYTAILAGKDNGTGVGLVEVYDLR